MPAFPKTFAPHAAPDELLQLFAFQESNHGFESLSEGFGLNFDDKGLIKTWSKDKAFLAKLLVFAQANGSGSCYALWDNGSASTSEMPVVVFGDEGGAHVVANNVRELLQILTYGPEPLVDHEEVIFYKGDDFEDPDLSDDYKNWLKETLDLEPVKNPKKLISAAQKNHKKSFAAWMKTFKK